MVMSHNINNRTLGSANWPGLSPGQLYQGDDLMWVHDFRNIYGEILTSHMGYDAGTVSSILNGYSHSPIGIY
ncbi:MAG: hypothetical protein KDC71_07280, partial [Acidobacteria bacterium]|nr:hypothetical protein [Acidobacteriota bacterium]